MSLGGTERTVFIMKKIKKRILKSAIAFATFLSAMYFAAFSTYAKVNLEGGVKNATTSLKSTFKTVLSAIFGVVTIVVLAVAIIRTIGELLDAKKQGRDFEFKAFIFWWMGVAIAGLATSSTLFGWFGL